MPLVAALVPLVLLIGLMTLRVTALRLPLSAEKALPLSAVVAYVIVWITLGPSSGVADAYPTMAGINAQVIFGLLASLTPLAIVFGAILLFETLQRSGAMAVMTARLRRWTPDPLAQVLLIGWAFSYLVEGLSGFGTPAALAAPILVGLGFPAIRVAACCLVMNSVPVVFGAVGTPVWFGLGEIEQLDAAALLTIGQQATMAQILLAPVVVLMALAIVFPIRRIARRLGLIAIVVGATVGGSVIAGRFSLEFPSIVGGLSGLIACLIASRAMARRHADQLTDDERTTPQAATPSNGGSATDQPPKRPLSFGRAVLPLGLVVLLLAITRIELIGLKALLQFKDGGLELDLGVLGLLTISPAAYISLEGILGTETNWTMAVLYVPFILPFVLVALLAIPLLRMSRSTTAATWGAALQRIWRPGLALAGALVLVKLMMYGGEAAAVMRIGNAMAEGVARLDANLWLGFAPLLGVLGSFFSGSATVSNLTFAPVQVAIAEGLSLDTLTVLTMQSLGAAVGNMVCIHNIVAVAAVLGLTAKKAPRDPASPAVGDPSVDEPAAEPVAAILKKTVLPMLACVAVCAAALVLM